MQDWHEVVAGLEHIAALLRFAGEPKFKIMAYERAAEVVKTIGDELGPMVEQDRLLELDGIGPSLSRQIQELWNSGESEYLNRLRGEQPEGAAELVLVEGMTPRRIRALHAALGIRSVAELRDACSAGRVRGVPGFGEKTEQKLLAACERWLNPGAQAPQRLILARALELAELIQHELEKVVAQAHVSGELRRGEETIAQLEFVIVGDGELALRQLARLRQVLSVDSKAHSARLSDGIQLQLHCAAPSNVGAALLLSTGNAAHVAAVRQRAVERGVALPEALEDGTARPELGDERALYAALGLALIPPELRAGRDELTLAAREDFRDLLSAADIKGMVHCHTSYSDGKNSIEEMARAAHALGMKYITITDHSASAQYAGGLSLERLKQQWDEIAAVQERVPIRILRGTESDILADGSLDYPDAVLEQLDVLIASIHMRHRMDRAAMTQRLERALSLPLFKIWGHALGRILNHRDAIDCDVPAVLDALARSRGAIELNADPHRLDLPPAWIPEARARGLRFVISVDAHSTRGLGVLRYGVTMARRGGLRRGDVLNTVEADEFARQVRPVEPGAATSHGVQRSSET